MSATKLFIKKFLSNAISFKLFLIEMILLYKHWMIRNTYVGKCSILTLFVCRNNKIKYNTDNKH